MNDIKVIQLTNGGFTVVDSDLFEELNKFKWTRNKTTGYIVGAKSGERLLHRVVTKCPRGLVPDHKNKIRFDNTRRNLVIVSEGVNVHKNSKMQGTSSKFKGVSWNKLYNKWQVYIMYQGKRFFLGRYENELDAARAYNVAALRYYGEEAYQNKLD